MVTGSTSTMTNENYKGDVCTNTTNIQAVYLTVEHALVYHISTSHTSFPPRSTLEEPASL